MNAVAPEALEPAGPRVDKSRHHQHSRMRFLERYALVGLFIAVSIFFTVLPSTSSTFPTVVNVRQVLSSQSPLLIISIALIVPLVLGAFDLSVGAVATLSAVVCATSMSRFHLALAVAVLLGIASGLIVGILNGIAAAYLRLNSIVITLGTSTLLTGLVNWYTQGNNILSGISSSATSFGSGLWLGIPRILYVVAVIVIVAWYVFRYTPFGRYLYAIGSNGRAAALAGINVARATSVCFVISATLSAAAGVLTVAVNGGAIISEGTGFLFPALTAAFLGATVITIGRYNVIGTVIGVLFVAASVSGLTLAGAASWVSDVFNGSALIVAITIATILSRRRSASSLIAATQGGL